MILSHTSNKMSIGMSSNSDNNPFFLPLGFPTMTVAVLFRFFLGGPSDSFVASERTASRFARAKADMSVQNQATKLEYIYDARSHNALREPFKLTSGIGSRAELGRRS